MTEALIIDDNRSTADALLQMLGLLKVPARVAYGSSAALAVLGSFTPGLILLDITMPGVDGIEVLGFLRREPRLANVPVLVITLDDQPETREKALRGGANGLIIKPATLDVLEENLKRIGVLGSVSAAPKVGGAAPQVTAPSSPSGAVHGPPAPIKAGLMAPDFELQDESGKKHRLTNYRGTPLVLYFYPEDDTPGCIKEACAFRDDYSAYQASGVALLGVSPDSVESHARFKAKYGLPFPLLADVGHRVCSVYGVWGEKRFMGRSYEGVLRTTFLIDRTGRVGRVFELVRPSEHSEEVLASLQAL